ncbi:gamma-glutamyltransferase [Georgenia yuyongxinii]|uniref:Glutathione hydrolase proenzyme n=1 Tax=Georgenia yuyongxinii TaxID=2589797 RepID=A0A552WYB7_9MICO|nr:gamma-glutamyltransferase [Georgenia yuyongxinii]TRW47323.1 gamma-glutamyltransferase [Georgenia yuyongxinii]
MSHNVARRGRLTAVLGLLLGMVVALVWAVPAAGHQRSEPHPRPVPPPQKVATATGHGGAVATLDPYATQAGLDVLKHGGNAVDAAVAASAMLGVTRPYDGSIGGGGFFVIYTAKDRTVTTIDARETAPAAATPERFVDPATGLPLAFPDARVSGLSVGVPGLVRGWEAALEEYGSKPLRKLLEPAHEVAEGGFVVDAEFQQRTVQNLEIFQDFPATAETFLVDGAAPEPGDVMRNGDLAATYELLGRRGADAFYEGELARAIADTVTAPPVARDAAGVPVRAVRPGDMTVADLADYEALWREPTVVSYRGNQVFGMGPPSSGGTTTGEVLNILEGFAMSDLPDEEVLHLLIEAEALAWADRNAYVGDPGFVEVPVAGLLSEEFAATRRDRIGPTAAAKPVPAGNPQAFQDRAALIVPAAVAGEASTTHLTVADKFGNVVSLTFSLEQIGGSGITVPGYGFLLNNQLTDFNFTAAVANDPNLPDGGKRPRSSMSPTIVLDDRDRPVTAFGSPGGPRIIGTVLHLAINQVDRGMTLPDAIAAPRLMNQNGANTFYEPGIPIEALARRGHAFTLMNPIGNANGVRFLDRKTVQAAAEPERAHGGSAGVLRPVR